MGLQEEDEATKVKFLQDQSHEVQKSDHLDCDIKGSKNKLGSSAACKIVSKLSPKSAHRKKKRKVAKFKVNYFLIKTRKLWRNYEYVSFLRHTDLSK